MRPPPAKSLLLLTVFTVPLVAARALAAPSYQVTINSDPPGASVYIDGKHLGLRGQASASFKIRLTKGAHQLLLELPGYKPLEQTIQVAKADRFTFPLERAPGRLEVRTPAASDSAAGAEVFIDGTPAGRVPLDREVPQGRHLLEVRKQGFRIFSESIEIRPGETRPVFVTLEPEVRHGGLLISADAPQAQVLIDGVPRGQAPLVVADLAEGEHLVEVRRPEEGAPTWQQRVRVVAGQQQQVLARPEAPKPKGGTLLVVTGEPAEVVVDGTRTARANQPIEDLSPGQHVIDVRAPDRQPVNQTVTIEPGRQQVVQVELPKTAAARGVGILRIILGNPVPGAEFYVNGRRYDESAALGDKGLELPAGRNVVVVRREGYAQVRKDVDLRPGGTETVAIDIKTDGSLRIDSSPSGAQVLIDGAPVGQTPYLGAEVPAGTHTVELRLQGYEPYVAQVLVKPGAQANVTAQLLTPAAQQLQQDPMARFSQTSLSALTLEPGAFTVDVGAGFPYFADLRLTVGAVKARWFGLDAGVSLRTTIFQTEVMAHARTQLLRAGPIALGANLLIGGGGGPRGRNTFVFEAGVPLTLVAGHRVRLTARPYLQVYSDRHCTSEGDLLELRSKGRLEDLGSLASPGPGSDRCTGSSPGPGGATLPNAVADAAGFDPDTGMLRPMPTYDARSALYQEDGTPVLDRFTGARFLLQASLEVVLLRNLNLYLLLEGAPAGERQAFTSKFNPIFPSRDVQFYGRLGLTFKF